MDRELDVAATLRGKRILFIGATGFVGKVIVVGSDNSTVPRLLGWERAETLAEAIAMGRSHMGRSAQITMLHHPPILITDVR